MRYSKFKVIVRCFTFNQATYITDALNGFTMQKTDFPFVCTVVDDASTDGEQQVIMDYLNEYFDRDDSSVAYNKETDYAHVYYAQHKKNKNCYFAVLLLKENHYSQNKSKLPYLKKWRDMAEYEAICEGDDYWIVSDKLQQQTNYMDNHDDCALVFTNANVVYDMKCNSQVVDLYSHLHGGKYAGEELLSRWTVPTASVLFRSSMRIEIPSDTRFLFGDIVIFLTAASCGEVYCINEKMVCYRRNPAGVSMIKQDYTKLFNHYQAISEHFGGCYKKITVKLQSRCLIMGFLSGHLGKESWQYLFKAFNSRQLLFSFVSQFMSVLKESV